MIFVLPKSSNLALANLAQYARLQKQTFFHFIEKSRLCTNEMRKIASNLSHYCNDILYFL